MLELDERVFRAIYGGDTFGAVSLIMVVVSMIGSGWAFFAFVPMLLHKRARLATAILLGTGLVQATIVYTVKALVQRERPWMALHLHPAFDHPTDFSFPSGHATGSFTVAAFVVTLLLSRSPRGVWAWAGSILAVAMATWIAVTRVYLGAHYPTDVLGGAVLGSAGGVAAARAYLARAARLPPSPEPTVSPTPETNAP